MKRESLFRSPQQVDPLSWFAGPLIPLVFAACELIAGVAFIVGYWMAGPRPLLQLPALALLIGACLLLHVLTRPHRRQFGLAAAFLCLLPAWAAVALSCAGYAGGSVPVEQWWVVMGLGLLITGFGPYLAAVHTALCGLLSAVVVGVFTVIGFVSPGDFWSAPTTVVLGVSAVLFCTVLGCVFGQVIVSGVLDWLDSKPSALAAEPDRVIEPDGPIEQDRRIGSDRVIELDRSDSSIARLVWRAAPFIERVADAGEVTAADRALAAQLARRLREDLVTRANRTWLDTIARGRPMKVLDPGGRADLMTSSQRSALRALLLAVLESPVLDKSSVLIELRGRQDGSTAVAMTMDLDLPEGRRMVALAPYYLTLKTSVERLRWSNGKSLELTFQLPPKG